MHDAGEPAPSPELYLPTALKTAKGYMCVRVSESVCGGEQDYEEKRWKGGGYALPGNAHR